jgi:hypothetical protein
MKVAVLITAYNEGEYIAQCIKQWEGYVDKVTVLLSVYPWNGQPVEDDGTLFKARKAGAEVIAHHWNTEHEQRSWGCARLYDYDWVIICDADEFYTKEDKDKLFKTLENTEEACFRANKVITYWKHKYVLEPPDTHKPIVAVDPKRIKFWEYRMPSIVSEPRFTDWQPVVDISMHHFSWSKPNHKIKAKIDNYSHNNLIRPDWYMETWLKWTPDMKNVRPYGIEDSEAVPQEPPQEIKDLIAYNE